MAQNATSATMVARRLLEGVYTKGALRTCSVTGLPPRGKGKAAYSDTSLIKPYLCPKGVNAIVCKLTPVFECFLPSHYYTIFEKFNCHFRPSNVVAEEKTFPEEEG